MGTVIIPILQMEKIGLREVRLPALTFIDRMLWPEGFEPKSVLAPNLCLKHYAVWYEDH